MQLTCMFSTAPARLAGLLPQTLGMGMMVPCRHKVPWAVESY